jgi:hypothetical protein
LIDGVKMMTKSRWFHMLITLALVWYGPTSKNSAANAMPPEAPGSLSGIDTDYLCRHWVHSVEEQTRGEKALIYRPSDFKQFPASRFRMQYVFYKNGDCEWYYLSPDDAHGFKSGKWRIDSKEKDVLQIVKRDSMESYRIIELTKDILRIVLIKQTAGISPRKRAREETAMTTSASGTFDVKMTPQGPDEKAGSSAVGRMLLDKEFHGDLEGTSRGQMLAFSSSVKGSAGYVAIEEVTGTLNGRGGTFVLQHSGTMTRGTPHLTITVVPDSGTGQLAGLTGKMVIEIAEGRHSYKFDYTLE